MITRAAPVIVNSKVIGNLLIGVDKDYNIFDLARIAEPLTAKPVQQKPKVTAKPGKFGLKAKPAPVSQPNGSTVPDMALDSNAE